MREIELKDLVVADARQTVTCTIYNADGSEYATFTDSIESYIARVSSDLNVAFMKFADSSYAVLN